MEDDLVQIARWFFLGSLALTVIVGSISWFLKRSKRERGFEMTKPKITSNACLTFEEMFHIESVLSIFLKETARKEARALDVIYGAQVKITAILDRANRDGLIDFKLLEASKVKTRTK